MQLGIKESLGLTQNGLGFFFKKTTKLSKKHQQNYQKNIDKTINYKFYTQTRPF